MSTNGTAIGQRRVSYSRATKPGFHVGRKPGNAGRKWPAEVLTAEEVRTLISQCSSVSSTGLRNRAIITVLYRAGLRINECLSLYPKDMDGEARTVRVLHGKGDKARVVGIDGQALGIVADWETRRARLGLDGSVPLFCSLHGTPLYASYVQATLKRLGSVAGLPKRVHPHGLRHTFAYELANEGVPMHVISKALGHSNIATTARYIDHLCPLEVVETIAAREWTP